MLLFGGVGKRWEGGRERERERGRDRQERGGKEMSRGKGWDERDPAGVISWPLHPLLNFAVG